MIVKTRQNFTIFTPEILLMLWILIETENSNILWILIQAIKKMMRMMVQTSVELKNLFVQDDLPPKI